MKKQFLLLIALAAFTVTLTTQVSGQTGKTVRANVKFNFQIGDQNYPAGEYQIGPISQSDNVLQIISVRDAKTNQFIFTTHSNQGQRQTPKLLFHKYGESYFLTQIVLDSGEGSYSLQPSRRQRDSEKILASRIPRNN